MWNGKIRSRHILFLFYEVKLFWNYWVIRGYELGLFENVVRDDAHREMWGIDRRDKVSFSFFFACIYTCFLLFPDKENNNSRECQMEQILFHYCSASECFKYSSLNNWKDFQKNICNLVRFIESKQTKIIHYGNKI